MKKLLAILLCMMMIVPAAASLADENVTITLWPYPIGKWVDDETVQGFFREHFILLTALIRVLNLRGTDEIHSSNHHCRSDCNQIHIFVDRNENAGPAEKSASESDAGKGPGRQSPQCDQETGRDSESQFLRWRFPRHTDVQR